MFAPEGIRLIIGSAALAIIFVLVGAWIGGWGHVMVGFGVLVFAFTLWFFRDPGRTPPLERSDLLLAPADGKIIAIEREVEPVYLKGEAVRISIFLLPLDVHVNRIPADGTIEHVRYVPGKFRAAFQPKASLDNERSEIGLIRDSGERVLFKQIAGAVARRIVYHVTEGENVRAGQRFGIVKFGSRMDVMISPTVTVATSVGDKVVAGETILGRFPIASVAREAFKGDEAPPDENSC